jgi:hypothetical protein
MDAERISVSERQASWMLWVGVLTGPTAWSLQVLINYNLEELACSSGARDVGRIWGIGVSTWILVVDIGLAAATLAGLLLSIRCLRAAGSKDTSTGGRARWMAAVGVMAGVLFLIIIASGLAPPFLLNVCEVSP